MDGFFKKSVESLLGYDLYTGDPFQGEREKEADRALSSVVDNIPFISNIKNYIDLTSGKDSISGDKLSPVDKVISVIGSATGPVGKKIGGILKGVFNGGKKILKRFGIYIDDLAERLGLGPRLQPAGGPPDIPRRPAVNRIDGSRDNRKTIFKNGKISIKDIEDNPQIFSGKSANDIANMLREAGYDVSIKASRKSSSGAQIIKINNPGNGKNITQVQVSPGGGRHGPTPYVKISTNDQGIIKVVDGLEKDYITD